MPLEKNVMTVKSWIEALVMLEEANKAVGIRKITRKKKKDYC